MKTKGAQIREEVKSEGTGIPSIISLGYLQPLVSDWQMNTHNDLARWSNAQRQLATAGVVMLPWAGEVLESLKYIRDTFESDELSEICERLLSGSVRV